MIYDKKNLWCWRFFLFQVYALTWVAHTFPCRRHRLNLAINQGVLVQAEGGVFLSDALCVNVHSAAFCRGPGSALFNWCFTKSKRESIPKKKIRKYAAQKPHPEVLDFVSVRALKGNSKPEITCLYLCAKRNLNSHLKCNSGQHGQKNIFSHLIVTECPSGEETGRKINIPTFWIFTGQIPLLGYWLFVPLNADSSTPLQACSFLVCWAGTLGILEWLWPFLWCSYLGWVWGSHGAMLCWNISCLVTRSLKVLILIYLHYYQEESTHKLFINVKKKKI